jgi:hypothetical protein
MWVIVAVTLGFADTPKLTVMPGREFRTKAECLEAVRVKADFDQKGGSLDFSICVPKDSVQIGQAPNPDPSKQ